MNEHLVRQVANRPGCDGPLRLVQPFPSPTRTVRLTAEPGARFWRGVWRPWTVNHAAEIHDLAHACGRRLGSDIRRIAFAWNKASLSHRALMTADDITLIGAEAGQPRNEMRVTANDGVTMRLRVVPPPGTAP